MEPLDLNQYNVEELIRQIISQTSEELPRVLSQFLTNVGDLDNLSIHIEYNLFTRQSENGDRPIASERVGLDHLLVKRHEEHPQNIDSTSRRLLRNETVSAQSPHVPDTTTQTSSSRDVSDSDSNYPSRPKKRRATGGLRISKPDSVVQRSDDNPNAVARRLDSDNRVFPQRRKKLPAKPCMQPSTLEKFIVGVWDNIFSGMKMDPTEVIEQWQAIEGSGQPKLLTDVDHELTSLARDGAFGRMNVLTRKISQTSRTCRSLEVLVQAHWVQCFDNRVADLSSSMPKERAKKTAMDEACFDFQWTQKELRNRMAIWQGYFDIQKSGGWVALVFAGMGLYRFCKYRVSFNEETYRVFRALRHRFEVAADTLHPRWRTLLAIVGGPTERRYIGHPHSWAVCGPHDEAIPLPQTYAQWDRNWTYTHVEHSFIDEDAWGLFDPRLVTPTPGAALHVCSVCEQPQSDEPRENSCACFPNLYGRTRAGAVPVQVFRTANGRNNGLIACLAFERGTAIGEFVGDITAGLTNLDVMVGQTDKASYQIFQGRRGNHTRFVNHSCQPNSQFERFTWLGTQRIVLVSKGVEAGEEVTTDYSDTYWRNLDKRCLCGEPKCRYRNRADAPPSTSTLTS